MNAQSSSALIAFPIGFLSVRVSGRVKIAQHFSAGNERNVFSSPLCGRLIDANYKVQPSAQRTMSRPAIAGGTDLISLGRQTTRLTRLQ